MSIQPRGGRRRRLLLAAAVVTATTVALSAPVADAAPSTPILSALLGEAPGLGDFDARAGQVAPSAAQLDRVAGLDATARWNRFGTPSTLVRRDGYLATGLSGSPAEAARAFIRSERDLFRLSDDAVTDLELLNDSTLTGSDAHAVLFRQRFGALPAARDGLITVAVTGGDVAFVSSSAVGDGAAPAAPVLSAVAAWQKAAANVGRSTLLSAVTGVTTAKGWTTFNVTGFGQPQRARLVALPVPGQGVRPAFEANVLDAEAGSTLAYTSFVDAVTGAVLVRTSRTAFAEAPNTYSGEFTATGCGPRHPFTVPAGTKQVVATAFATVTTNDIVVKILNPDGTVAVSGDTGTSPEAATISRNEGVPAGDYSVQVCPYDSPSVPFVAPMTYTGTITTSEVAAPSAAQPPARWKYFPAFPSGDNRVVGCWIAQTAPGCQAALQNTAARAPWDYDTRLNVPTFTTTGNAARTAEAWTTPLTPGAFGFQPVSPTREYAPAFTDAWNKSKCDPAQFTPGTGNDIPASVVSLFAAHNRMHDWSYHLGFTERNYNLQANNFGNQPGTPGVHPTGDGDPEIGQAQAGALTGGAPSYLGRDNANQITLQDGIPGITNQYLFQPIAGGFYAPCTDGGFDMSIVGHEYTHAISNRMVGGPDEGLSSDQGGAMGESWSDQVAMEYQQEYGLLPVNDDNPFAVGVYATGNKKTGIRNYAMNDSPLHFGNVGYDITGPQVHADGEIWSATNFDIRAALMKKYDAAYPSGDKALQRACADGKRAVETCPGNRRWMQLVFDAFLLQQPGTSMLDARDALLAADLARFGGANQKELWRAFAARGFGAGATTAGGDDTAPKPDFTTPVETSEGTVRFSTTAPSTIYLGAYEARSRPVADTDPDTPLPDTVTIVPATYQLLVRARGYGLARSSVTVGAGQTVAKSVTQALNLASATNGATATGDGGNLGALIDDTEATNWAVLARTPNARGARVAVDLAGTTARTVRSVRVSALLHPAAGGEGFDPAAQNRFTALRKFALDTCVKSDLEDCAADASTGWKRIYVSAADAFPGVRPRPLAPNLTIRSFDVPDTAATHVRLVVLETQCTGGPDYAGEQDNDPLNATDCTTASTQGQNARVAELQVF